MNRLLAALLAVGSIVLLFVAVGWLMGYWPRQKGDWWRD